MLSELLFHLVILIVIALITILPAGYILDRHRNKNTVSFFVKNRRDTFWLWILPSSVYLGYVAGEHGMMLIGRMFLTFACLTVFTMLINFPFVIKQPIGWILKYKRWLEYPKDN
jgi:cell division protein FtsW (lipid II flippase)